MPENVESFQNLVDNLNALKLNLAEIPYVLQYNKRDLPNAAPVEYMEFLLNNREVQVPSFSATAHKCEGVFETLNMITRLLLHKSSPKRSPVRMTWPPCPNLSRMTFGGAMKRCAHSSRARRRRLR